tara:strand:- start:1191 stop:1436 length:246 start_codon:yes stop_codon:yes gene_type:complete
MEGFAADRRVIFRGLAMLILLGYVYILYFAFSRSHFIGTVVLATFPLILIQVIRLVRWKDEREQEKERTPIFNKPNFVKED